MKALLLFLFPLIALSYPTIPPVNGDYCTPSDPDFKEYRYIENIAICERNVTTAQKIEICKRDGVVDRTEFTVDHLISLSMGGSNSLENLWCQHKSINFTHEEYLGYIALRDGTQTQAEVVEHILDLKFRRAE